MSQIREMHLLLGNKRQGFIEGDMFARSIIQRKCGVC